MKRRTPTPQLILSVISIGIATLVGYSSLFNHYLLPYGLPTDHHFTIIIPSSDPQKTVPDTIAVKKKFFQDPTLHPPSNNPDYKSEHYTLNLTPQTMVYVAFHSGFMSVSIMLMLIMIILIREIANDFQVKVRVRNVKWSWANLMLVITTLFAFVSLMVVNFFSQEFSGGARIMQDFQIIFSQPELVKRFMVLLLSVVGLVPFVGIAYLNFVAHHIHSVHEPDLEIKREHYQRLRGYLNTIAFLSSIIVAGIIIGTRLQRNMIGAYLTNVTLIYPNEGITIYGASFTLILAIFFVPTLLYIQYFERAIPAPAQEKTAAQKSWFKIGRETIEEFQLAFSILLPFILSLLEQTPFAS